MKFYKVLEDLLVNNNIDLYVDFDGVLAEYDLGNFDYNTIRPLKSIIKKIEDLSLNEKVNIFILSICKKDCVVEEKKVWLDQYLSFIKKENVILISKEDKNNESYSSKELKSNYLKTVVSSNKKIVIDDDISIIKYLKENNLDVIIFHNSSLVD